MAGLQAGDGHMVIDSRRFGTIRQRDRHTDSHVATAIATLTRCVRASKTRTTIKLARKYNHQSAFFQSASPVQLNRFIRFMSKVSSKNFQKLIRVFADYSLLGDLLIIGILGVPVVLLAHRRAI